jgi:hypothetical protein
MLEKWHFHVISDLIRILVDFRQGDLSLSYGGGMDGVNFFHELAFST